MQPVAKKKKRKSSNSSGNNNKTKWIEIEKPSMNICITTTADAAWGK
jgi:hypothetical protein